mmetsp:Transcript_9336/g.14958  ORF Transcript_9336/g.14958 Transcript_9336/m.14958 type:complete len:166 (+) Transcript_9336:3-500(+)
MVLAHAARLLSCQGYFLGVDINPEAAIRAKATLRANKICNSDVVVCDLLMPFKHRLKNKVDLMLFNPPYVPTPSSEIKEGGLAAAWAGGSRGREVLDRLLPSIPSILSDKGVLYLVTVEENDPEEISHIMAKYGFESKEVVKRRAANEGLAIYRYARATIKGNNE